MAEIMVADVLKEAITAADDQIKFARKMLSEVQNEVIGLITGLVLLVILIAIAGYLGRKLISESLQNMGSCLQSAYTKLGGILNMYWYHKKEINKEYVKSEIKASIVDFRSMIERLKVMKSQKINTRDVKDIKAAIKTVRSIEENLTKMKSQNINEEEVKEMEGAIQPAIKAVESMEKIINKGVWLLP